MRVGIIELLVDTPTRGRVGALYATHMRKQFVSITPQAVSVWCRQLGHDVFYATYHGQSDPERLLPDDLDVVFVSAYTQASALAYALARLFRRSKTLTVIGGPHAKSFPVDCLRFFDLVVDDCDKTLVDDMLRGRFDPPAAISSGRRIADLPSVEERLPEIAASVFVRGRPIRMSVVPMLASVGCPYTCDFCIDWNSDYRALPKDRLEADLAYLSRHLPGVLIAYHDPNFAVRFDETMDIIEAIPAARRNPYIMESSLSILKESRLHRLRDTNCVYVAPGIESWANYSNKAGAGAKTGRDKLEQVVHHFELIGRHVPGMQANFLFGTDSDCGDEPVELTREFVRRLPAVFPTVNIPTPFGGTPLFDNYLAEGRILRAMPFAFYFTPHLVTTLRNYHPREYYDRLIDISKEIASNLMLSRRVLARSRPSVRFIHALRTLATRWDIAEFRRLRRMMASDAGFMAFHEGRSDVLPEYYRWRLGARLGRYAELLSPRDLVPTFDAPAAPARPAPAARRHAADRPGPAAAIEPVPAE